MCRLAAYIGPQIPLENIVTAPSHSLLSQSKDAYESKVSTNGDGFGIAWYGVEPEPGLYRDCLPAWADENLTSLCRLVQSTLFIAHVRASTTGATMRANCHPFVYQNWSFAHNGQIGGFKEMQRSLEHLLSDDLYLARQGSTDSELFFLLLLQYGLSNSVDMACGKVIGLLESMRKKMSIGDPLRIAVVIANGKGLFALRYASDQHSPTLYRSNELDNGGISIASEPLDSARENWVLIKPSCIVEISDDGMVHERTIILS